jgi:hypothetical protein
MVPKPSDFLVFRRPEGEVAMKELCESLEFARGLLADRAGQAQLDTTGLEPLPQDRRSLAFVQVVFKHNFSPSNIEDAIIALKDFQFEVESCQQTTELAFQQVWRVYDIVKTRTLQRRSSVSTVSTISTLISESTEPQATASFRREIIDWLKRQDVASKSHPGTPSVATRTGRGLRTSTSVEDTSTPESRPIPRSRNQELLRSRIRFFFGLSRAKQADEGDKIEPFGPLTPPPLQLSPFATQQPVHSNRDVLSQQQLLTNTTIYGQQQPQTVYPGEFTDVKNSDHLEKEAVFTSQLQTPPPIPVSQVPLARVLPPRTAYGVGSLGRYTFKQGSASPQPPSQPWSNKPLPAVLTEKSQPSISGIARPPRTQGRASGDSVEHANDRPGVKSHDKARDDSIHYEEKDKSPARGFFGSPKEREREKGPQKELTRMIGVC